MIHTGWAIENSWRAIEKKMTFTFAILSPITPVCNGFGFSVPVFHQLALFYHYMQSCLHIIVGDLPETKIKERK